MQGASRESVRALEERLEASAPDPALPGELLAVAALLDREAALRTSLTDPSAPAAAREGTVHSLLTGRVSAATVELIAAAAAFRWSRSRDLPDALEMLGASAAFAAAERAGTIDTVEDELFRFGRTVTAEPQLRAVLDDPQLARDRKLALVRDLLGSGRVQPLTLALVEHVVASPRGRRLTEALDDFGTLAARRRQELVAEVRVAAVLSSEQERRLGTVLHDVYGRRMRLQIAVDPTVLGGAVVRVGDEVYDGSVSSKLTQARRRFAA